MSIQSVAGSTASAATPVAMPRQNVPDTQMLAESTVVTQQAPAAIKDVPASRQQLDEAIKSVSDFVSTVNNSLQFSVDNDTGKNVVKIVDISTKEVIKQIPSEEMLVIAKALDKIKGLLVQQTA